MRLMGGGGGTRRVKDGRLWITAASLDAFSSGDGEAWLVLQAQWSGLEGPLIDTLMRRFPR